VAGAALALTLLACLLSLGSAASGPGPAPTALYPGKVSLRFTDAPGGSTAVDCARAFSLDVVVMTDGRPVAWRVFTSDKWNIFIGDPIPGIQVTPASGALQGGQTAIVHISGPRSTCDPGPWFWIGATDLTGNGVLLEVGRAIVD